MSPRTLAVLEALGEQFRGLPEPPPRRARLTRRTLVLAAVLTLLLAGVAAAAILIARGAPLPAPNALDLQSSGVPLASTVRLAGLDAPDPDPAEPPWDIRLSRTRAGETCTAVGQVLGGQFGIVGLDRVFRALPLGGVDACGVDAAAGPVLAGARVFVGASAQDARTVVNGVAGAGARSVTVYGPEGPRALTLGPDGSFITVYRGYVEEVRPRVVVVTRDGRTHAIAFARSVAFEVPDPAGGGSAWQVSASADLEPHAYPDESCAQASQLLGRNTPSQADASLTPLVCGRLGARALFALIRRFVPESGFHTGFPWGNNASRTLVYGAAAPRVAALTLTGAGPARALAIDPHGGAFLAVLDGHVDPRALTLTARLRDGRTLRYRRSSNLFDYLSNRPLREPPVPAYRSPRPAREAEPPPPDVPIAGTVREDLRAKDPTGGPEWVLRSWQGSRNPRANFGGDYHPALFLCLQVGVIENHALVEPRPGSSALELSTTRETGNGGCNAPSDLERFPPTAEAVTYLQDPYAYSPRPLRTVVSGMLRLDATHPLLLGAGAARPLALDANRAFLAVLPGRYWNAPLRVSADVGGRTVVGSVTQSFPGPPAPATPQARAPDPNGGAPWGFAAGADGSTAYGRIVDGAFASIDERSGTLHAGPSGWSGGGTGREPKRGPVRFDAQGGPEDALPGQAPARLPRPEIERRTLPGRTIITGVADADVVSVTIATPRDVRTLRPSGPQHVLIVVYDGQFFRGFITATVLLRDGRTVTEQVPNGPGAFAASAPPPPSLAELLRSTRRQLERERRHPPHYPRFAPTPPPLLTIAGVIERRLAYERTHPGLLPPP